MTKTVVMPAYDWKKSDDCLAIGKSHWSTLKMNIAISS